MVFFAIESDKNGGKYLITDIVLIICGFLIACTAILLLPKFILLCKFRKLDDNNQNYRPINFS